jgi:hypothetical protein
VLGAAAVVLVLAAWSAPPARAAVTCKPLAPFAAANFHAPTAITNPYLPLLPGTQAVLDGTIKSGGASLPHRVTLTVTDVTKVIDGVRTLVLWDVDTTEGRLVESELTFFAQDDAGNVWNLGEYPEEYDDAGAFFGAANTWIAGLRGAEAGVHMAAQPTVSTSWYFQGSAPDIEFLDCAHVTRANQTLVVPAGTFQNVLVTSETSPLDPQGGYQIKYYAPGVGNIRVGAFNDPEGETLRLISRGQLTSDGLAAARQEALRLDAHGYEASDVYGQTPRAEPPPPPPPPPPPVVVAATSTPRAPLTVRRARSVVRRALRARLRHWTITRVSCRRVSDRRARCRFAARRPGSALRGSGVVVRRTTSSAVRYRLRARIVYAGCRPRAGRRCSRTLTWSSTGGVS